MVERVDGLSPGVRGEQLNLYFEFSDDFSGLDARALWEDVKAAGEIVSSTAPPGGGWRS